MASKVSNPDWEARYQAGELPWDHGTPDPNLMDLIGTAKLTPCPALELGCGTGTNAIWLAQHGFTVTAVDLSPTAIDMARKKAGQSDVRISFRTADILTETLPSSAFRLVFDRGCFHSFHQRRTRHAFAQVVADSLQRGGHWISLIGSTDGPDREVGPPRRSVLDIADAVETRFEILELRGTHFATLDGGDPPRAWRCLMRKRD